MPKRKLDDSVTSSEEKVDPGQKNPTSILKHDKTPRSQYAKGLRFEDSSSEEEEKEQFTRVTRRRIINTRSKARKETNAEP